MTSPIRGAGDSSLSAAAPARLDLREALDRRKMSPPSVLPIWLVNPVNDLPITSEMKVVRANSRRKTDDMCKPLVCNLSRQSKIEAIALPWDSSLFQDRMSAGTRTKAEPASSFSLILGGRFSESLEATVIRTLGSFETNSKLQAYRIWGFLYEQAINC